MLFVGYLFVFILCQQNFYNSRIPSSIPPYEPLESNASSLQKWGHEMRYAATKIQVKNPETRTAFHPKYGIVGNVKIAILYPWNLIQGFTEAAIFWLTLLLALMFEKIIKSLFIKFRFYITIYILYSVLLISYSSNIYYDYKDFGIPIERGWYYPLSIILFIPIWQSVRHYWKKEKI